MKNPYSKFATQITQTKPKNSKLLELMTSLKNKPFYCRIRPKTLPNTCCTWHKFPPTKPDGSYSELYPFQQSLVDQLFSYKRIALNKARGIGATQTALTVGIHYTLSE